MLGNAIIVTAGGTPIPASTSCSININQEAVEYTPLPGSVSAEEAGWKHYRRGNYSWSLQNDSFLTKATEGSPELMGTHTSVNFKLNEIYSLSGIGVIKSIKIAANINALAKLEISIEGANLPILDEL